MKKSDNVFSDAKIIEDIKSDKPLIIDKAMEQLYIRYYPVIRNFITKNSGNEEEAADIYQDALIVFYKKARTEDLKLTSSLQTYIYSICRNLWLDVLKTKKKHQILVTTLKEVPIQIEEMEENNTDERLDAIIDAMKLLGDDCKKILGLYYFDKMRMKQIAVEMGYANENVAKNLKGRCMKKLKELVKNNK